MFDKIAELVIASVVYYEVAHPITDHQPGNKMQLPARQGLQQQNQNNQIQTRNTVKRTNKKPDLLFILTLFVGLGVIISTLTQRASSVQDDRQAVSQSSITIKNNRQPLDPNILVKVNETRQRKPADSNEVSNPKSPTRAKETTVYQF